MTDSIELAIGNMNDSLSEMKSRISYFRKKGMYTKIAELRIASIPSKIAMLSVTKDIQDIIKITKLITQAKNEIAELEQEQLNIKNQADGEIKGLNRLNLIIQKIEASIAQNKLKEAKSLYEESVVIYSHLDKSEKEEVFGRLSEFRSRLA